MEFSHLDTKGKAVMVDVSEKQPTKRIARASAKVKMKAATLAQIKQGGLKKGDVLSVANLAGIAAAKNTSQNILMCHNIPLSYCTLDFEYISDTQLLIRSEVCAYAPTGVEMEALNSVAAAALNVYDMCKSADKDMTVEEIRLDYKSGGKSGEYVRSGQ